MSQAYDWINRSLDTIKKANWYRQEKALEGSPGAMIAWGTGENCRSLVNFASNDYLGLASDERVKQAAIAAIQHYGAGSTGSRLLSGHRPLHYDLEQAIAHLKQTEAALVFSSGYLANVGTITALVNQRDLVLGDAYNHSCLKLGAIAAKATTIDYDHANPQHLAKLLETHRSQYRRCLITTDSVFSMDGDLCPLLEILELADRHDCMVLVDEAHGTGVLGDRGSGVVEHLGAQGRALIQMGTLSKALGSLGGYVAGSAVLIDFLRNRAPSWIYTTALSPADAGAALAALQIVQTEPQRRDRLRDNTHYLRTHLQGLLQEFVAKQPGHSPHFHLLHSESPILCLEVADAATVIRDGQQLLDRGFFVSAVRPPTVPTSRLRLTVMATHTQDQLDGLIAALRTTIASTP